jgi:hypothetical protein
VRRALRLLLVVVTGCSFDTLSLTPAADARAPVDAGGVALDAPSLPDAAVDAPLPASDAAVDAPLPPPDAAVDAPLPAPDAAVDAPLPPPDAAIDAPLPPPDAPLPPPDAAPDAAVVGVQCGQTMCPGGQFCCVRSTGQGTTRACHPSADCPMNGDPYACDGPEDCEGSGCCDSGNGSFCLVGGQTCLGELLCHTDDDCPPGDDCEDDRPYDSCD